jgi:chromosome segregation ATPase
MRRNFTSRSKSSTNKRRAKSKEVKSFPMSPKNDEDNFEKKITIDCAEMKEIADKIHRANVLKIQENKIKDEEIDALNEEIRQLMITNFDLQTAIHKELELRHTYETEQRKIAAYCNDLSYKFRNMEKTISDYENTVKSMKKQNEDLADAYDKKIEEIDKENKKLQKRIDDRIELYNHQKNEIYEKTAKVDNLGVEIQRQKDLFNERNYMNKAKFDELEAKYKDMLKKVYELQLGIGLKKADGIAKKGETLSPEEIKKLKIKEIEEKVENCEQDNDELVEEINKLNKQYKEMSKSTEKFGNTGTTFSKTNPTFSKTSMSELKSNKTKTFFKE